jgi:hypothetical protein
VRGQQCSGYHLHDPHRSGNIGTGRLTYLAFLAGDCAFVSNRLSGGHKAGGRHVSQPHVPEATLDIPVEIPANRIGRH